MQSPIAISSFNDNYIWLIVTDHGCWVVDPGDAKPVIEWLETHQQRIAGVLLTHHHADHIGGVQALAQFAHTQDQILTVWGPDECQRWRTHAAKPGDLLNISGMGNLRVMDVSAHTLGHIAYFLAEPGWLFCGDSLFSAGCGRLFEGTPLQLFKALKGINDLPAHTQIFPAHEYTQKNLAFAQQVEPSNVSIALAYQEVSTWREQNIPSLPTTLERERLINPFLRLHSHELRAQVATFAEHAFCSEVITLTQLRQWKDLN
jgi:hydroxyacylglutathione hydrolase